MSKRVQKRTVTLNVSVPDAGKLAVNGAGVTHASRSASGRQSLTIKLTESHAGPLRTKVHLRFTPGRGKQRKVLTKTVTVAFR